MSNLKVNTINDASGGSNAVLYGVAAPANSMGFRNRIINGNMVIDQRNAGASVAAVNTSYQIDRWRTELSGGGAYTVQQSTTAPSGFTNSALITVTTADSSIAPTDYYDFQQLIEGFNVADLGWGTASAQTVTLSFWARSSVTGTFAGALVNNASNRSYVFTYTVNTANTFEYKTVTIPGDTSGTWVTNNGRGIALSFDLGNGSSYQAAAGSWVGQYAVGTSSSVKLISTSGATFYITGVQLEAGSVASPFERRDYGRELMMCQRYYEIGSQYNIFSGYVVTNDIYYNPVRFTVTKRTAPSVTPTYVATSRFAASAPTAQAISEDGLWFSASATLTGTGYFQYAWVASAEL
jgi:hypothetical protein